MARKIPFADLEATEGGASISVARFDGQHLLPKFFVTLCTALPMVHEAVTCRAQSDNGVNVIGATIGQFVDMVALQIELAFARLEGPRLLAPLALAFRATQHIRRDIHRSTKRCASLLIPFRIWVPGCNCPPAQFVDRNFEHVINRGLQRRLRGCIRADQVEDHLRAFNASDYALLDGVAVVEIFATEEVFIAVNDKQEKRSISGDMVTYHVVIVGPGITVASCLSKQFVGTVGQVSVLVPKSVMERVGGSYHSSFDPTLADTPHKVATEGVLNVRSSAKRSPHVISPRHSPNHSVSDKPFLHGNDFPHVKGERYG